jgi:hypothetical protein
MVVAAPILSALVATAGLIWILWRARREQLRHDDVLKWANEGIEALQSLVLVSALKDTQLDESAAQAKITEIIFRTSILVERGRLLFKNCVTDDYGNKKEPAYRGYRPRVLDPIVLAHQIACKWAEANQEMRVRLREIAAAQAKKFVSLMQKEVGRSRTASAETSKGGDGWELDQLIGDSSRPNVGEEI